MSVRQGLEFYNENFVKMTEYWDKFIQYRVMQNPNIWHDRILRGAYTLFSGDEQSTYIYRGGLPVQAGLASWRQNSKSIKTGQPGGPFDNCNPHSPQVYTYAWDKVTYSGYTEEWQSEPLCVRDLRFVPQAVEQVKWVVKTGVDYSVSILENWNREMYIQQAMLANRGFVMSTGALGFEDQARYRFAYSPFTTMADKSGQQVPFVTFDATLDVSTLNWDYLDYLRTTKAERAGEAALARESGMPIFGLMIDLIDFERYIKSSPDLYEDWRMARPTHLIDGYGMGMKMYRGFALIHDARQPRFYVHSIVDGRLVCPRVLPLREGRAAAHGRIPEPNPEYYRAEIGMGVIFMNDVFMNLFVPTVTTLGSGTSFGPSPGLAGLWQWVNIPDPVSNVLGESGFFYGRLDVFPKPLLYSTECTVFLYKRCAGSLRTRCITETHADTRTGAVGLAVAPTAAEFDATRRTVALTLVAPLRAGVGDLVTVVRTGPASFTGVILSDSLAPQYLIGWAVGATNAPTAVTQLTVAVTTVTA